MIGDDCDLEGIKKTRKCEIEMKPASAVFFHSAKPINAINPHVRHNSHIFKIWWTI